MSASRSAAEVWRVVPYGLLAAAVAVIVIVTTGGSAGHTVYVTVPEATGVISGQYVRSAGSIVGDIASATVIDGGRSARLALTIDDNVWPLPQGTTMTLRWGGTISAFNRYIELDKGSGTTPIVGDGGAFPPARFHVPVEYDQLLGTFTPQVRASTKTLLHNAGAALTAARPGLHAALPVAPDAVNQASAVLADLGTNQGALRTMVESTAHVVDGIDTSQPGIGDLVAGAGTTMRALASHADALQTMLSKLPATFDHVRGTLARASVTLIGARQLMTRLSPGVQQLRTLAGPLDNLLTTLTRVGPDAATTLEVAAHSAPQVTSLVGKVEQLSPELTSIATQANPELDCIRPYTPDLTAFFTDWGSALSGSDGANKFIRANVEAFLPALDNFQYATPAQAAKLFPGLTYAFPRPPGYMANQNWFLPQCGITQDSLNPAKDPETKAGLSPIDQIPHTGARR